MNRLIDRVRGLMEEHSAAVVVHAAARALPGHLRKAVLAVAADLVLVDGKLEGRERRFLTALGVDLDVDTEDTRTILDVIALKNSA